MKPNILIFIDWFNPGFKAGGPVRSVENVIAQLSDKVDFKVITRNTDYLEVVPYSNVPSDSWVTGYCNASVYYTSKEKLSFYTVWKTIKNSFPTKVLVNGIYSFYFSLLPVLICRWLNIPVIVSVRGMLAPGALGIKSNKKKVYLFFMRLFKVFSKVTFHATNLDEEKQIKQIFGNSVQIKRIPNLVQTTLPDQLAREKKPTELKLIWVARIAPEKNLKFALEVLLTAPSGITFDIYGPLYNQSYWEECLQLIKQMPAGVIVNYKGVLEPNDFNQVVSAYHGFFLPTLGENFGHSIVQAMSCGCMLLISDRTPWRNLLESAVGADIPLDNREGFSHILRTWLSMDQQEFNTKSKLAYLKAHQLTDQSESISAYSLLFE